MPRPGPRPYECVRRAWHSDRHQPMRGSLIQEIFRVVNEIHSSVTKKNKEWQEKLPIVVLKAEEIMYSKANSEAEYLDPKTLWERTNDAINTIIRRDEGTECGDFLQPCIEAALNLGCTPRRASRSQRNVNPRCYLSPNNQEPTSTENTGQGNHTINPVAHYPYFMKPPTIISSNLSSECPNPAVKHNICTSNNFPFISKNVPQSKTNQCSPMENCTASNLYSVYPLYYGNGCQFEEPHHGFGVLPKPISNTMDPVKLGFLQNPFSFNVNVPAKVTQTLIRDIPESPHEGGCDLSLRLGPLSVNVVNNHAQEVENISIGSNSQEWGKVSDLKPPIDKESSYSCKGNIDDPLNSCSSKWGVEDEHINADAAIRKRKAVFSPAMEDEQFCWQLKLPYSHLTERMKSAGL